MPPEIGWLSNLTNLNLSFNLLETLPSEIGNLVSLEFLHLTSNRLTRLPQEIGCLCNLKELLLEYNRLTTLPEGMLRHMLRLRELQLTSNRLTSLPSEIGCLTALQVLSLQDSALTSMPYQVAFCTSLRKLWLHNNPIPYLPCEFAFLPCLVTPPVSTTSTAQHQQPQQSQLLSQPRSLLDICCGVVKNASLERKARTSIPQELIEKVKCDWRRCYKCRKYYYGEPVASKLVSVSEWGGALQVLAGYCSNACAEG